MESPPRKGGSHGSPQKTKYPEQHKTLLEMGFDNKSINQALESTNGNLEAATAVLLGEPAPSRVETPTKVVPPMRVVGKQSTTTPKKTKADIEESHNKFMATYKITKCKDKSNHDKRMCYFWHSKADRRRNPFEIHYSCTECPNSSETATCENGDNCLKAHNMLERMFHPDLFKISMCQKGPHGSHCERGNLCAFAHSEEDHRSPPSYSNAKGTPGTAVSQSPADAVTSSAGGAGGSNITTNAAGNPSNADPIQIGKSMSDSRLLDQIQGKLVALIKNQGADGIISSELPKRYYDAYSERLELADEAGEKFRIKDLLLSHPHISVTMHKGVQPKYIYEELPMETVHAKVLSSTTTTSTGSTMNSPTKTSNYNTTTTNNSSSSSSISSSSPATSGLSYSAMANQANKPRNYAAAATTPGGTPAAAAAAATPSAAASRKKDTTTPQHHPSTPLSSSSHAVAASSHSQQPLPLVNKLGEASNNQWATGGPGTGLLDSPSAASSIASPGGGGSRPRGPDGTTGGTTPSSTPGLENTASPGPHNTSNSNAPSPYQQQQQFSPGQRPTISDLACLAAAATAPAVTSGGNQQKQSPPPPGLPALTSATAAGNSPGGGGGGGGGAPTAAAMVELHQHLAHSNMMCDKLQQQVLILQAELNQRSQDMERQGMQLQGLVQQLNESTENQNKANNAKDNAVTDAIRARMELDDVKAQTVGKDDDINIKNREISNRDYIIAQIKQEKLTEMNQYSLQLNQIENALIEMQRKEAMYINEIPLHDTINESSRARDELTKFVNMLKHKLSGKITSEASSSTNNTANGGQGIGAGNNFLSAPMSMHTTSASNSTSNMSLESLLGMPSSNALVGGNGGIHGGDGGAMSEGMMSNGGVGVGVGGVGGSFGSPVRSAFAPQQSPAAFLSAAAQSPNESFLRGNGPSISSPSLSAAGPASAAQVGDGSLGPLPLNLQSTSSLLSGSHPTNNPSNTTSSGNDLNLMRDMIGDDSPLFGVAATAAGPAAVIGSPGSQLGLGTGTGIGIGSQDGILSSVSATPTSPLSPLPNTTTNTNNNNGNPSGNSPISLNSVPSPTTAMVCSLPGCQLEGTFICSACNRTGYCGAQHQRDHWVVHILECSGQH